MSQSKPLALVTGASRGIGSGIAEKLGSMGFHVLVNYVSQEGRAIEVVKKIEAAGGSAEPLRFDVSKEEEIVAAFEGTPLLRCW
jgi:3-oxoacyl-[acyl-carrier protein] reductase